MPSSAIHLTLTRTRQEAIAALQAMSDEDLGRAIQAQHLPWFNQNPVAWNPNEPEFEATIVSVRAQAYIDIDVAYGYQNDRYCDDQLATGRNATGHTIFTYVDLPTGRTCPSCGDDDGWAANPVAANPVSRLIALGVCTAPRITIVDTLDFPAYRLSTTTTAF